MPTECLILSGDHLYRMDYRPFVEQHRQRRSDVTIAVKPVPRYAAPELGILKVDGNGRIVDFVEKPQSEAVLDEFKLPDGGREGEEVFLASMGIYLFECSVLTSLLIASDEDDFGRGHHSRGHRQGRGLRPPIRRLLAGHRQHPLLLRCQHDVDGPRAGLRVLPAGRAGLHTPALPWPAPGSRTAASTAASSPRAAASARRRSSAPSSGSGASSRRSPGCTTPF